LMPDHSTFGIKESFQNLEKVLYLSRLQ
jgi:hypothetical protein